MFILYLLTYLSTTFAISDIKTGNGITRNDLTLELHSTNARLTAVEKILHEVVNENKNLKIQMDTILKMVLDREVQTQDTNKKIVQNPRADDDEEALRKRRSIQTIGSGSYRVAFTAKNQLQMSNVADHQKLIFDQVLTNIGGNYNAKTGLFQAEVSGAYLFFSDIGVLPNKDVSTGIVKDGTTLVEMYSQTPNVQEALDSDSNMAIIHLNQGDSVWIEALRVTDHSGAVISPECSFSGFLLYPDQ